MPKKRKTLFEQQDKLGKENEQFSHQLMGTRESFDALKAGEIDALVIANEKDLKVFTKETSDKTYRILIEQMHEGAVTLNNDETILYCNSYFATMVKLPLQKVIGTKFNNFLADDSKERFKSILKKARENPLKEEAYIFSSDGKPIPVRMSVTNLVFDSEIVLSIILTDLTIAYEAQERLRNKADQLKKKNKELERANKELAFQIEEKEKGAIQLNYANTNVNELEELNAHKENILAILSHDLRSPLAGIIGIAEYLKTNFERMENAELKVMLNLLHKSTKDELNMLDYLVEWARIKYASETFSPAKIKLSEYVSKVFKTLNETAALNSIHLLNEIDEKVSVFADGKMVLSILQNLVSNAVKYTHRGEQIIVRSQRKEDKIIIEVNDSGIGMSKEILEKLFTRQMNTLSIERKANKGAGIGLLLVKGFLEKNGGEIWVESTEGVGSSFYFTLPVGKQ